MRLEESFETRVGFGGQQLSETERLIESLSEAVHDAWWNEKKSQGFHAPYECEVLKNSLQPQSILWYQEQKFVKHCDKCHTDMYPYSELAENIKEYDRVTVRTVLQALDSLGIVLNK